MDFEKAYHEIWDALAKERDKNARLTAGIARIADDYYPDGDDTAALALSEMREALTALLAREDGE